jgi:molybdate transport system regulatory protein
LYFLFTKVWIVFGDRVQCGHGRAQLLQTIDELGSLRKAAVQLGMSYRHVWGYLRTLAAAAGFPFLERRVGEGTGRHDPDAGRGGAPSYFPLSTGTVR